MNGNTSLMSRPALTSRADLISFAIVTLSLLAAGASFVLLAHSPTGESIAGLALAYIWIGVCLGASCGWFVGLWRPLNHWLGSLIASGVLLMLLSFRNWDITTDDLSSNGAEIIGVFLAAAIAAAVTAYLVVRLHGKNKEIAAQ